MTRLPSGASTIDQTAPFSAVGAHGSSAPVVRVDRGEVAARACRSPRRSRRRRRRSMPVAASARTWLLTLGAKEVSSAPVAVLKAATWPRATPSTVVKSPPT